MGLVYVFGGLVFRNKFLMVKGRLLIKAVFMQGGVLICMLSNKFLMAKERLLIRAGFMEEGVLICMLSRHFNG